MSNKQEQAKKLGDAPDLSNFNTIDVKLTEADVQLITMQERRKAMLINNVARMFAEQMNHLVGYIAKKKNTQFNEDLFAGVFFDAAKGKAQILQYKSVEEAQAARNPQPVAEQPAK